MSETTEPAALEGVPENGVTGEAVLNEPGEVAETSEAEASESGDDQPEQGANPKANTPRGVQKKLDELTVRWRSMERDRDYWREMAVRQAPPPQQQPSQASQPQPLPPEIASAIPAAPKPEDFPAGEFDPKYAVALAKHEMRMEQAQAFARHHQMQRQQATAQMQANLTQQVERLVATDPQARDTIAALGMRLPNAVADMVAEAGADIAYYIARNPEAEKQIAEARSPAAVARAIGRIEARLEAARAAPSQPTAAPAPPPRAAKGTASASRTIYDAKDFDEYAKLRGY